MDADTRKADAALKAEYPSTAVDLIFTADERWSAPLVTESSGEES